MNGSVIGKLTYQPQAPLECGARLWLELDESKVEIREHLWPGWE